MRRLVLVKHSLPEIVEGVPAAEWHLGEEGLRRAESLAARVDRGGAPRIYSSVEPKAVETASVLASAWNLPLEPRPGLHEHERPEAQLVPKGLFEARVRELFERPADRVFGAESAREVLRRFTRAVLPILARSADDVVIVAHGTAITLFVSDVAGVAPFALWRRLELPSAVTLSLPELRLLNVEGAIPPPPFSGR